MKIKNILLVANSSKPNFSQMVQKIVDYLSSQNIAYTLIKDQDFTLNDNDDFDLALTLGGDGTVIALAKKVIAKNIPVLALNFGQLGFFTAYEGTDYVRAINDLVLGNLQVKNFSILNIEVWRDNKLICTDIAVNDAVVASYIHHRLISYEISINGDKLDAIKSDAFIVSSTIGSTAYAMSAGGPIITPDLNVFVLVPVCPFILAVRPFVVSSNSTIEIMVHDNQRTEVSLNLDGEFFCKLLENDKIIISEASQKLSLLRPENYSFYYMVKNKLGFKGSN